MKQLLLLFTTLLSSVISVAIDPDGSSTASGFCKCYSETPEKASLALRKTPIKNDANLITRLPNESRLVILEKSVAVENGHVWHKVQFNNTTGYVAHWVHCKETVQSKNTDRTFYGNRLLVDSLAKVKAPGGANNTALINKWYKRYKTEEYYQGAVRRGWERISKGNNLEFIYNECLKEGVPYEVVLLALIESSWYPHKNNHAGAAGYWQFIPSTGIAYGLTINSKQDDRLSIEKSTRAAIKFLKGLSIRYDDAKTFSDRWCFAFAAYNRGPAKVTRTFNASGKSFSKYPDMIDISYSETRNYVPKIFGLRKFLKEYLEDKFFVEVYKSPADIAYEGYVSRKDDMKSSERIEMLKAIESMYREEISLKNYGEDRDEAYSDGALKEIASELDDLE